MELVLGSKERCILIAQWVLGLTEIDTSKNTGPVLVEIRGFARKRLELGDDRGFRSQGGSTANLFELIERGEPVLMDVVRVLRRVPLTRQGLGH
jgi:hypothetical protein